MTAENDLKLVQQFYDRNIEVGLQPLEAYYRAKSTVSSVCKLNWDVLTFEVVSGKQQPTGLDAPPPVHSNAL